MKNLIDLIEKQIQNLKKLLGVLNLQQQSIINSKLEEIEKNLIDEELCSNEIRKTQLLIDEEVKENHFRLNIYPANRNIKDLISFCKRNKIECTELEVYSDQLRTEVKKVIYKNTQNRFLVETSRGLIRNLISQLMDNKNLLDRKV